MIATEMAKEKITEIPIRDNRYPKLLKEIYEPPACLYTRGFFEQADKLAIGVVGTRNCTAYGRRVAEEIVKDLVAAGLTIVSGLAKGIDATAHQAALDSGGRTIAVLGSAIDDQNIYPASNKNLARKISQQGVLVSEYPEGTKSERWFFAKRNRIISGLSLGVLVIEAPARSGALITASQALEQNREVFVIPGSIYEPNSVGTNKLIQEGAKLVISANDILSELNLPTLAETKTDYQAQGEEEKVLLKIINRQGKHIDEIIKSSKLKASVVNSTLTVLEIKRVIKNLGSNIYAKL